MLLSVLLTTAGGALLFVGGGLLFPYLPSSEQRKKIVYDIGAMAGLILCVIAVVALIYGHRYHYSSFAGKMITPGDLDKKMIYQLAVQTVVPEVGNVAIVANAEYDLQLVGPQKNPLKTGSRFFRPKKSPEGWVLDPVDIPWSK